jgi:osmotically-inducible protein OsmY
MKVRNIGRDAREGLATTGRAAGERAREVGGVLRDRSGRATRRLRSGTRSTRRRVGYWVAGERPPSTARRAGTLALAGLAGAAVAFFLDPISGKRRRHVARDKAGRAVRRTTRLGRVTAVRTGGLASRVAHIPESESPPENDQTLAHKVESELFQRIDIPSGQINIMAEHGVVSLRGTVKEPQEIREIERLVRGITGVADVQNLLHLEGTPAPTSS